jgi:hypothetical protein
MKAAGNEHLLRWAHGQRDRFNPTWCSTNQQWSMHSVALVSGMRCNAAPPVVPSLERPLVEHWRIGKTVKEVRKMLIEANAQLMHGESRATAAGAGAAYQG